MNTLNAWVPTPTTLTTGTVSGLTVGCVASAAVLDVHGHELQSYRGQSNHGHFEGFGQYLYSDGSEYTGNWIDGVRSGTGTFVWPNGETYTGSWSEHKRNGRGKYEWPDGRSFEGDYVDDLRTGHGFMEWPDGTRYEVRAHNSSAAPRFGSAELS